MRSRIKVIALDRVQSYEIVNRTISFTTLLLGNFQQGSRARIRVRVKYIEEKMKRKKWRI